LKFTKKTQLTWEFAPKRKKKREKPVPAEGWTDLEGTCSHYMKCRAPLCPLDPMGLKTAIWYPGEAICRRLDLVGIRFIQVQKGISRSRYARNTYFTAKMLERVRRIARGLRGLEPDGDRETQQRRWLKEHPPRKRMKLTQLELVEGPKAPKTRKKGAEPPLAMGSPLNDEPSPFRRKAVFQSSHPEEQRGKRGSRASRARIAIFMGSPASEDLTCEEEGSETR
jgi:hypothetical protein